MSIDQLYNTIDDLINNIKAQPSSLTYNNAVYALTSKLKRIKNPARYPDADDLEDKMIQVGLESNRDAILDNFSQEIKKN